jgi:hypothetical protein
MNNENNKESTTRHSRAGGNPDYSAPISTWIPVSTGNDGTGLPKFNNSLRLEPRTLILNKNPAFSDLSELPYLFHLFFL